MKLPYHFFSLSFVAFKLLVKYSDAQKCEWCNTWNNGSMVSRACPVQCRECCADDPGFSFKVRGRDKNCEWLATKRKRRRNKICPRMKNGMLVEDACIDTCGLCIAGERITAAPSLTLSNQPTTCTKPTQTPSNEPTSEPTSSQPTTSKPTQVPSKSTVPTSEPTSEPSSSQPTTSKPTQVPSKSTGPTSEPTSSQPTTSTPPTSSTPTSKPKPNILLILADDIGVGDVKGYWDDSQVHMPFMEDIVNRGTTFFNVHSTPLCAPSRYLLLSGNYQYRGRNIAGEWYLGDNGQFQKEQMSIAEVLKTKGNYHTAVMGKWHLGGRIQPDGLQGKMNNTLSSPMHNFTLPIKQGAKSLGFDSSLISMGGIQSPPFSFFRNDYLEEKSIKFWNSGEYNMTFGKSKIIKPGEGAQDWDSTAYNMILVNETNRFLDRHMRNRPNDPFFAYVALGAAHKPHTPPNTFLNGAPIAGQSPTVHMDMLSELDMTLGALTKSLEDRGLMEDTIIIFTSDNGGQGTVTGSDKYNHHSNSKLRGQKGSPYEGGHRVPFIMRYDGVIPAGGKEHSLIGLNDVFATLCDIADIQVPFGQARDSLSFADLIIPDSPPRDRRENIWISRFRHHGGNNVFEAVVTPKYKLIRFENGKVKLYDLENDLSEKVDLSQSHKKVVETMQEILRQIGPPLIP